MRHAARAAHRIEAGGIGGERRLEDAAGLGLGGERQIGRHQAHRCEAADEARNRRRDSARAEVS